MAPWREFGCTVCCQGANWADASLKTSAAVPGQVEPTGRSFWSLAGRDTLSMS